MKIKSPLSYIALLFPSYELRQSLADAIRERDDLKREMEKRTMELKQAQNEKVGQLYRFAEFGKLSSGLFHDLMKSLGSITAHIGQLEKDGVVKPKMQSSLAKAIAASRRMARLIDNIKKQVSSDTIEHVFPVNQEIEDAVDILEYRARESKIEIVIDKFDMVETYGNPLKFHQIVINLIANAIDAYTSGISKVGKVTISLAEINNVGVLTVSDEGCGIPDQIKGRIFDAFFTTKPVDGIGLGLSSTKEIVEKCFNGNIFFKSIEGNGSIFTVTFPIQKEM